MIRPAPETLHPPERKAKQHPPPLLRSPAVLLVGFPSAEELRQQIAQARRELEAADHRGAALGEEITQAHQRQDLRRLPEKVKSDRDEKWLQNFVSAKRRQDIDNDRQGIHMPLYSIKGWSQGFSPRNGEVNVTTAISKGEYVWKLQGMSWIENALAAHAEAEDVVWSEDFRVGDMVFDLVYAPTQVPIDFEDKHIGSSEP